MKHKFTYSAVAVVISSILMSQTALAKENKKEKTEVIIVTGTPGGVGISKKEASFAVTNIDASDIEKLSPKSTADLFKAVPGIWVESSGGESGANVFVRGFPSGGDAPFLTLSIEGSPVYPAPTLSFLENSSLFRLDETIETMEALRGGPNPVLSNGQPGLTTNFRLKRGSEDTEAIAKYTTSDYGLQRVDLVLSGELSDNLYYMIGGYVKRSPGIRDAQFTSEKGQQYTINITKILDNGEIDIYTRQTNDRGTWYLPTPLNINGIDAGYTQIGTNSRQATITFGPDNQTKSVDFGEGRGWNGSVSGGSIKLDLANDWHFIDRFNLTKGKANTFGFVPNGAATTLAKVADNGRSALGAVTNTNYDGATNVQQIGRWVVLKDIEAFTNDIAISKQWDKITTSFGFYTATTSANDWWSLGNQAYYVLQAGGEMLDGIACNTSAQGCGWNYDINSNGDTTTKAFYTTTKYEMNEDFTFDIGLRRENHQVEYSVDEGLDGKITKSVSYNKSKISWTTGVNYNLNEAIALFGRLNKGYKMPYFDDFRDNFGAYSNGESLIKEVSQGELGFKFMSDKLQAFVTIFSNEVKGDTFVARPGAPAELLTNKAFGAEFDVNYANNNGFNVNLNATLQDTEITASAENKGNQAQRQPKWQIRMTPSYEFEFNNGMYLTAYGTLSAVGDRYSDNANTVTLPGYKKIDLGMIFEPIEHIKLQLAADNLTNELGITEGDPRNPTAPNGRYIMPRSIRFSASYEF